MIGDITLKICGITSSGDARAAAEAGADWLGFNFYPKSHRFLPLEKYAALADRLPRIGRTAILVEPSPAELAAVRRQGFDSFQIHFRAEFEIPVMAAWSAVVGKDRLWLAPRLPPDCEISPEWLGLAEVFLLDTYQAESFGGSGRTGDWGKFARCRAAHPDKTWILSGGLNPKNIAEAVKATGARFVDANSGVETAPGIKDPAKLRALAEALRRLPPSARARAGDA